MVQGATEARVGDNVRIGYRISKTGDIYVESIGGFTK